MDFKRNGMECGFKNQYKHSSISFRWLSACKPAALIDVITKTEKLTGHHRRVSS